MLSIPFAVLLLALGAVQAPPAPPVAPPPPVRLNPDPESPPIVEGWWTNGERLIELAEDGAYRIWTGENRHRTPIERGRWSRQHYAALWLQPYTMRKEARTRVAIGAVGDAPTLQIRDWKPMRRLDGPPPAPEDLFIGLWVGPGGSLDLQPTMRYHYAAPRQAVESRPVAISSHRGVWFVEEGRVVLQPDSPAIAVVRLEPEALPGADGAEGTDDAKAPEASPTPFRRLRGVEGTMDRVVERNRM